MKRRGQVKKKKESEVYFNLFLFQVSTGLFNVVTRYCNVTEPLRRFIPVMIPGEIGIGLGSPIMTQLHDPLPT
jgi:hypothetical protein